MRYRILLISIAQLLLASTGVAFGDLSARTFRTLGERTETSRCSSSRALSSLPASGVDERINEEVEAIKKKGIPEHHREFLRISAENRKRAAARRLANSKRFWKRKVVYDHLRKKELEKRREQRAARQTPREITRRTESFAAGEKLKGKVLHIKRYGAYVDVGAQRLALLHVKEMSEGFTAKVEDAVSIGDTVDVYVKHINSDTNQIAVTMFPTSTEDILLNDRNKIPLSSIEEDDELWGEVMKVSNLGAFVHVGAEVAGFLHRCEWPNSKGRPTEDLFSRGQRVRVYAKEVDLEAKRLKLTAIRPESLPQIGGSRYRWR